MHKNYIEIFKNYSSLYKQLIYYLKKTLIKKQKTNFITKIPKKNY